MLAVAPAHHFKFKLKLKPNLWNGMESGGGDNTAR